ncbi:MAG: GNAT family N-acetyltransferase [Bacteroidia bacterium]|nr:GNAT family N-acetyltransferase [Bacteroidia bacterium]
MAEILLHRFKASQIEAEKWDAFIKSSPQAAIYALHGYISTLREDWEAFIVEEKGEWKALMPFIINKKGPFRFMPQAPLTQHWGVFFEDSDLKSYQKLSKQGKIIERICAEIEEIELFDFNLAPDFPYALPFHWHGFELKTRFTYQLDLTKDLEQLEVNLESSHKRQIRKAKKHGLEIRWKQDFGQLEILFQQNLDAGNDLSGGDPRILPLVRKLHSYLETSNQGYIHTVYDAENTPLASGFFAHLNDKMYYLIGAQYPKAQSSGAMTYLMWESILKGKEEGIHTFDFEGSMIAGIEQFFRKFGSKPVPYLQLYKNNLPLWAKWLHKLIS